MPDNREWAIALWLGVLAVFMLARADLRASTAGVLKAIIAPQILAPLAGMILWVSMLVVAGIEFSLWDVSLATKTLVWFFASGLLVFASFAEAAAEPKAFLPRLARLFGITFMLGSYLSLAVFSLPIELLLQPVVFLVLAFYFVADIQGSNVVKVFRCRRSSADSPAGEHQRAFSRSLGSHRQTPAAPTACTARLADHRTVAICISGDHLGLL